MLGLRKTVYLAGFAGAGVGVAGVFGAGVGVAALVRPDVISGLIGIVTVAPVEVVCEATGLGVLTAAVDGGGTGASVLAGGTGMAGADEPAWRFSSCSRRREPARA